MENILIEIILTNQCNKRCIYCDLKFKNSFLSFYDLDLFINFLKKNKANYSINFFWWEPLLAFDKIIYFINKTRQLINKYSIWTNWILLDKEKLDFFKENNFNIYLSIDNISLWKWLNLELFAIYNDILIINFINDPDFLNNSILVYKKIKQFWFKDISFMPVFSTKKWDKLWLKKLKEIYIYILANSENINVNFYKYFNWVAIDKQFILDTDLFLYSDIDSLLWLQKQYKNVDNLLKNEINSKTKLFNLINNDIDFDKLLKSYNIKEIIKLIFEIPKRNWDIVSYKLIDKIFDNEY